jgi:hypothetical protein
MSVHTSGGMVNTSDRVVSSKAAVDSGAGVGTPEIGDNAGVATAIAAALASAAAEIKGLVRDAMTVSLGSARCSAGSRFAEHHRGMVDLIVR